MQQLADETLQPALLRALLSRENADAFMRMTWNDITNQRVLTQTHQQDLLRRNALEIHGRNYAPLVGLHWGLTSLVAGKVGKELLPSFAFFRMYFAGDICRVHSDRAACEVSLSLTLAYSDDLPWDLCIAETAVQDRNLVRDDFDGEPQRAFTTMPGDAVLYSGTTHRHGRVDPNPNRWSAHVFLQWVTKHGAHESEAFERLDLGEARPTF